MNRKAPFLFCNRQLIASIFIAPLLFAPRLFAYGYLSEFVAPDGSSYRESSVYSSDLIQNPSWNQQIDLYLCTSASSRYDEANLSDNGDKQGELLADIQSAIDSWKNAGNGTSLNFGAVQIQSSSCGSGSALTSKNGRNEIFFNTASSLGLPSGVIGYTILYYEMQSGVLRTVEADIFINSQKSLYTSDYIASHTVNEDSMVNFSFLGVLTHEMGHLLGLCHSGATDDNNSDGLNTYATMFASVSSLGHSMAIETPLRDDIAAINNLYPSGNSFSGSNYSGSISGNVYSETGFPQRSAQVTAFSLSSKTTLATAFTGVDGTKALPEGAFEIKGLPLNEPFIIITEPLQRPASDLSHVCTGDGVHPNFVYSVYNVPISTSLASESEGYQSFAVEAYPDVNILDVRSYCNTTTDPGISSATSFTLTDSSPSVSGLKMYVSNIFYAPNDAYSGNVSMQFNPDDSSDPPTITNSNPLILDIEIGTDLGVFENPSLTLTAQKDGSSEQLDWSSIVPSFEYRTSSVSLSLNAPSSKPANGTYTVTAQMSDDKYGSFSGSRSVEIRNWTKNANAGATYEDGTTEGDSDSTPSSGGGGGCQLSGTKTFPPWALVFGILFFISFFLFTRLSLPKR